MSWCSIIRVATLMVSAVALVSAKPLTVITSNNPHEHPHPHQLPDPSNLPPIIQWSDLYEKEVGTWCAPETSSEASPPSDPSPLARVYQQLEDEQQLTEAEETSPVPLQLLAPQARRNVNDTATLTRWVDAALRLVRSHLDDEASDNSSSLTHRPVPSDMNLYVAAPTNGVKLMAILPDGAISKSGARDAWLLLDPSPSTPFGHVVYVFAVDFNTADSNCLTSGGTTLGNNECLTQVFKKRCPNLVSRRSVPQQSQWRHRSVASRRCDIDFLPLVYVQNEAAQQSDQRLLCSNDVDGFAPCPLLRSWNETSELICDPLSTNNKRCDSTQELVKTRCRLFETCDQAVLLSGGWNWQLSGRREMHHLLSMYRMLRHNGFGKHSVKIFFANGVRAAKDHSDSSTEEEPEQTESGEKDDGNGPLFVASTGPVESTSSETRKPHRHEHNADRSPNPAMYPAALKIAMRNHIRTLCATSHCVDSFVIYLSSPTRTHDGASLLWDADHNGQFDETEIYTIREFLRDIQDCAARQVVVLADQNHSGLLADALTRSRRHANVLMFTSTQTQGLSVSGQLTKHWANYAHGHACLNQVFQDSVGSTARFEDSSNGTLSLNLFGAPCDAIPPYSRHELKTHYMGCQYVPTRIWLSRQGSATDPPPRLLSGR